MHSYYEDWDSDEVYKLVLILVLMEDALVLFVTDTMMLEWQCLNPCFNGRCTRTNQRYISRKRKWVLILVLMEDALVQENQPIFPEEISSVLILVLMEDALVLTMKKNKKTQVESLNPCFNGRCTRTYGR